MNPDLLKLAEAAKACAANGLIRHNPQKATRPPAGKRSHRNGSPISPARMAEVAPEILERLRRGEGYIQITQSMGVAAGTITAVKRANGMLVKGYVRDGKMYWGCEPDGRERWI